MKNSEIIKLSLAKIQIWRLLEKQISNLFLDCHIYKQGNMSVLIIEVKLNKAFILKVVTGLTSSITKLIGEFRYQIVENIEEAKVSPKLALNRLVSQFSGQKKANIAMLMNRVVRNCMTEPNVKGVELLVKGIIFGNRKSKRKISEGKQKYTGHYLREYNRTHQCQIHVPKGSSGVTLKVFLNTPAKYDLKAYLEELKLKHNAE